MRMASNSFNAGELWVWKAGQRSMAVLECRSLVILKFVRTEGARHWLWVRYKLVYDPEQI